jgi:hypothetical protein
MAGKQALSPNQHSLCETRQIGVAADTDAVVVRAAVRD